MNETTSVLTSEATLNWVFQILGLVLILTIMPAYRFLKKIKTKQILKTWVKNNKRSLIAIIHKERSGFFSASSGYIDNKTLMRVAEAMEDIGDEPFDLLLHTGGGDVFASIRISELLRNHNGEIRAIIPHYSMSGGSLLALSCDKILMQKNACLGPIDAQVGDFWSGVRSSRAWAKIVDLKGTESNDSSIGNSFVGKQVTETIKKILITKINKKAADELTNGEREHIYPYNPKELGKLGIDTLETKMPFSSKVIKNFPDIDVVYVKFKERGC